MARTVFRQQRIATEKPTLPGLIVVCFGRFWVRDLPFPNARRLGTRFIGRTHLHGTPGPPKSESFASKLFRHSALTLAFKNHV